MRPKKSLGQHFLHSETILKKIVAAAEVSREDTVLEIGPGTGTLTAHLIASAKKVVAVEKDQRVIPALQKKFTREIADGRLEIIYGDALDFSPSSRGLEAGRYKLVANIPYYITGSVLKKFLSSDAHPSAMALLVQKEVALRIAAADKKESILSISVKTYGMPRLVAPVSRDYFTPRPRVDSAILSVHHISKKFFSGVDEHAFFKLVRAGFQSKRKTLINNLEVFLGISKNDLADLFKKLGIPRSARAENLALGEWKGLTINYFPHTTTSGFP